MGIDQLFSYFGLPSGLIVFIQNVLIKIIIIYIKKTFDFSVYCTFRYQAIKTAVRINWFELKR